MDLLCRRRESLGMSLVISRKMHNDVYMFTEQRVHGESTDNQSQRDSRCNTHTHYTLQSNTFPKCLPQCICHAPTSCLSTHDCMQIYRKLLL